MAPQAGAERGIFAAPAVKPKAEPEEVKSGIESLTKMARVLFVCLRLAIILVLIYLFISGVFRVDEQNEAMLFRFGALQTRVIDEEQGETAILTSGRWYWAWPYPIDRVKELPAQRTVTVSTDRIFEPLLPAELDTRGYLTPGADGYLMCMNERHPADAPETAHHSNGVVHAIGEVNYRIVDAKKYYLTFYDDEDDKGAATLDLGLAHKDEQEGGVDEHGLKKEETVRGTQGIIKLLLGNAMISEGVSWTVEELRDLTRTVDGTSQNYDECVKRRLSQYINDIDMGIEIQSVKVTIHLPAAVKKEFESVFSAAEQSASMVQMARQEADQIMKVSQNEAFRIRQEAEAERDRLITDAEQDSKNFLNELAILRTMDGASYVQTVLLSRYMDTLNRIYGVVENKMLVHPAADGRARVRLRFAPPPKKKAQQGPQAQ